MFWKAPGSNLEVLGPIFETPRVDLDGFWIDFFEICGHNAKRAKKVPKCVPSAYNAVTFCGVISGKAFSEALSLKCWANYFFIAIDMAVHTHQYIT